MKNKIATRFFYICKTMLIGSIPLIVYLGEWQNWVTKFQAWSPWVTVLATALSPLIAIQVSRYLDEKKQITQRKIESFEKLMAYRQANVTEYNYLSEFNIVPIIFREHKNVLESFDDYFKAMESWSEKFNQKIDGTELQKALDITKEKQTLFLYEIAVTLDMEISKHVINKQSWWPSLYGNHQEKMRNACDAIVKIGDLVSNTPVNNITTNNTNNTPTDPVND